MANFSHQKLNPIDIFPGLEIGHVIYDPELKRSDSQYQVIRQSSHDGTSTFTSELLARTMIEIVNMQSFSKRFPPDDWSKVISIRYRVGPLWLSTVYGEVSIRGGKYPGMKQRTRMNVVCEYITKMETK